MCNSFRSYPIRIALASLIVALIVSLAGASENKDMRHFMFIGEPNAKAWQYLLENPEDRRGEVSSAFQALGGKIVSYYFGLGNGKNYIIVELPNDNELIQAVYLMRLPSGLLNSYEVIELMPSDQMSEALKRSKKLIEGDSSMQ